MILPLILFDTIFLLLTLAVTSEVVMKNIAGTNTYASGDDGIIATAASLKFPSGIYCATSGDIYFTDSNDNRIRKIASTSNILSTFTGTGTAEYNGDNIQATSASVFNPAYVIIDETNGILYLSEKYRVRKVSLTTGIINTVLGSGSLTCSLNSVSATSAGFYYPGQTSLGTDASIYIAITSCHQVVKVSKGIVYTIAGTGSSSYNGDNIPATSASLMSPMGVWATTGGEILISEYGGQRIRSISTSGIITTLAGVGVDGLYGYNTAVPNNVGLTSVGLYDIRGIYIDTNSNVYMQSGHVILKISLSTNIITTIAGTLDAGYNGDGLAATSTTLAGARAVWVKLDDNERKKRSLLSNQNVVVKSENKKSLANQNIVVNLVTMTEYIGNQVPTTFQSSTSFASVEGVENSTTVILMFSTFWAIGLLLVSFIYHRNKTNQSKQTSNLEDEFVQLDDGTFESAKEILNVYFDEIIPKVFISQPVINRLINEIFGQHRYATLIGNGSKLENEAEQQYVDGIKLLTTQCMMMFIMALFYDFQYPQDDGSCVHHTNSEQCLTRRSPFDNTIPYCSWTLPSSSSSSSSSSYAPCQYDSTTSSTTQLFIITAVMMSFFTGILIRPIDMLFYYLLAPLTSQSGEKTYDHTKPTTLSAKLAHQFASVTMKNVFPLAQTRLNEYNHYVFNVRKEYIEKQFDEHNNMKVDSIDETFKLGDDNHFKSNADTISEKYQNNNDYNHNASYTPEDMFNINTPVSATRVAAATDVFIASSNSNDREEVSLASHSSMSEKISASIKSSVKLIDIVREYSTSNSTHYNNSHRLPGGT
eukprot:gene4536-6406_t